MVRLRTYHQPDVLVEREDEGGEVEQVEGHDASQLQLQLLAWLLLLQPAHELPGKIYFYASENSKSNRFRISFNILFTHVQR